MKFAEFLGTSFFIEGLQWPLVLSQEFRAKIVVTVSNKYQIQLKKSTCCGENLEAAALVVLTWPAMGFPVIIEKFLRTPISKNISERLLLKISTSVINLPKTVKS